MATMPPQSSTRTAGGAYGNAPLSACASQIFGWRTRNWISMHAPHDAHLTHPASPRCAHFRVTTSDRLRVGPQCCGNLTRHRQRLRRRLIPPARERLPISSPSAIIIQAADPAASHPSRMPWVIAARIVLRRLLEPVLDECQRQGLAGEARPAGSDLGRALR